MWPPSAWVTLTPQSAALVGEEEDIVLWHSKADSFKLLVRDYVSSTDLEGTKWQAYLSMPRGHQLWPQEASFASRIDGRA